LLNLYPVHTPTQLFIVIDSTWNGWCSVWIDIEKMQGSTVETMAAAVEDAVVVCYGISQEYKVCRLLDTFTVAASAFRVTLAN
jgi:hypothetical protein